jgi:hypothetical protein
MMTIEHPGYGSNIPGLFQPIMAELQERGPAVLPYSIQKSIVPVYVEKKQLAGQSLLSASGVYFRG